MLTTKKLFDQSAQIVIPFFTLGAQALTAMKYPEWGLVANLMAQPFWLYSSWRAYKEVGQSGMFVTTVFFMIITAFGVINYWFLAS